MNTRDGFPTLLEEADPATGGQRSAGGGQKFRA